MPKFAVKWARLRTVAYFVVAFWIAAALAAYGLGLQEYGHLTLINPEHILAREGTVTWVSVGRFQFAPVNFKLDSQPRVYFIPREFLPGHAYQDIAKGLHVGSRVRIDYYDPVGRFPSSLTVGIDLDYGTGEVSHPVIWPGWDNGSKPYIAHATQVSSMGSELLLLALLTVPFAALFRFLLLPRLVRRIQALM